MRILVLGGTAWLGRTVAAHAVALGHHVTCVARGTDVPEGVTLVRADRDGDDALAAVADTRWDGVIDVSRDPAQVRRSARDLVSATDRYVFVSTVSVYASDERVGADEDDVLLEPSDDTTAYGAAKVACERAVLDVFGPDRSVIARAGLIGGPGDHTGRSGYWPWRFAHPATEDGSVVVPDAPELPTAIVDVRDLAAWLVATIETEVAGVYNAVGTPVPFSEHLDLARAVAGHEGPLVRVPGERLADAGVQPWAGPRSMPLWLPDAFRGMNARSNARAVAAGLQLRSVLETLSDALRWELQQPEHPHGAGLTDDEVRELAATVA